MKVRDLTPHPGNPRKASASELKRLDKTMQRYGEIGCILHNETTGNLGGGNLRTFVLPKDAKIVITEEFDVPDAKGTTAWGYVEAHGTRFLYRRVRWDIDTENGAMVAANNSGGSNDYTLLTPLLIDLDHKNVDIEETGFSNTQFEDLCAPKEHGEIKPKEKCPTCGKTRRRHEME